MASQIESHFLACRAVGKGNVVVGNLVPEMDLWFAKKDASSNRVNGCVSPSLIEETAIAVKRFKIVDVLLRPQPFQASDFEVGPL